MFENSKVLILDAGNTQVKCTLFEGDSIVGRWILESTVLTLKEAVDFIAVVSVRDDTFTHNLELQCRQKWPTAKLARLRSESVTCGVKNSYKEAHRLGVDRWLAVIAAYHEYSAPLIVLDAGTAIKADFIDEKGVHLGGYIAPGLDLMTSSLLSKTAKIRYRPEEVTCLDDIPSCTADAVTQGVQEMALGFIQRLFEQHVGYKWLVTGGAGQTLIKALSIPHVQDDHLVAKGARLALQERIQKEV
ncbi:type III pantothenate kinase [Marinomonas ostreistagni]|uniref:Type III pantothenate kinase n=1 Tax=Marinomonas ostreistagni TaxID=359209 RepID=A0ABS0ZGB4_9GAMM|nr:type III pantothenate kinase [Marinomonas ostreistagni]MBJ7552468.1 type III pantothenate kinase [Marinomonas ostreistagni]